MKKKTPERTKQGKLDHIALSLNDNKNRCFNSLSKVKKRTWDAMKDSFNKGVDIICSNCNTEYTESIRICEVCGVDFQNPITIDIELPTMIGDKYAMNELTKNVSDRLFEELQNNNKGYRNVSRRVRY